MGISFIDACAEQEIVSRLIEYSGRGFGLFNRKNVELSLSRLITVFTWAVL